MKIKDYKKTILLIFSLLGIISLFLPYKRVTVVGCGKNFSSMDYYYDNLAKSIFSDFTMSQAGLILTLLGILVIFSLSVSPILFLFNKIIISVFLIVVTLILMFICFYNLNDDLGFGYYVIIFQQITLLLYIVYSKNKSKYN